MTPVIVAKLCGILSNLKIPLQEVRGGDAHLLPYLVTSREGLCELGTRFCPSLPCCLSVGNFTPDTHKPRISSLKSPAVFQESLHQTISHLSVTLTFPKLHVSKCPSCGHSVGRLAGEHLHLGASSAAPPGSHPSNLKTPVMSKERNKDNFFFFLIPIPTGMDWEKETLTLAAPSAVGRPHAQDWEHRGRAA
ncbi:uncharacterized protein LOC125170349 isoform X2 [Prionailurus viverrinus]|uniref:uncharacterized protein LOC125170349 isoform X2 n=1 Tax=Prionailurus viverrinus TaxID=61388 RepID=UPI001FF466E9|nr:uncharacterized protein LOC125170349 isoform X2 [Prionailurus viverrinus]